VIRNRAVALAVVVTAAAGGLVGADGWSAHHPTRTSDAAEQVARGTSPPITAARTTTTAARAALTTTTAALTPTSTVSTSSSCPVASPRFRPRWITMPRIITNARVVAPPRVAPKVPGAPPLTTAGKKMFAWDTKQNVWPGDLHGHVLLNAHVWPDGSAVGNWMLAKLHVGDRIVVKGTNRKLCYRVTKRVQVLASVGLPGYYTRYGPPRLAIVTCSGRRLGPGVWTKRTVWYAAPQV
jgi:hypothetical protein